MKTTFHIKSLSVLIRHTDKHGVLTLELYNKVIKYKRKVCLVLSYNRSTFYYEVI